ncbi:MAG: diaminopimelate epimerase [Gammaproteobacteria bacterium]|nr:diaminopimelate epimerase [Gammaproteobacteria bacterium]
MMLRFSKMHGLGNDFVVFDATTNALSLSAEQARDLADRHFGIGCDQILIVEKPRTADTEFYYRIFNADGSEVEQCGNGARCFARFVSARGLSHNSVLHVGTVKGNITLYLENGNQVRVNMGIPEFEPTKIPIGFSEQAKTYHATVDNHSLEFMSVSMGNPHAVLIVDDVNSAPVETLGPVLENHSLFPERINVGFMAVKSRQQIDLRVFERGSGETLACGTGACAAMVCGKNSGLLDNEVIVSLPGGQLTISWQGPGEPVWMTGPAEFVFEGEITL